MKKSLKIYISIMVILALGIAIFEIAFLMMDFKFSLDKEKEQNATANDFFSSAIANSLYMFKDYGSVDDSVVKALGNSIYDGMENKDIVYVIYKNENRIFQSIDNALAVTKIDDLLKIKNQDFYYFNLHKNNESYFLITTSLLIIGDSKYYIRTIDDIKDIYYERNIFMKRLLYISLLMYILLGLMFYMLIKSYERNYIIKEEKKQLEELYRKQEEFSASFAHECRTPLTSIIGYSDVLRKMNVTDNEKMKSLDYIYDQGKRLLRLTKQLLVLFNIDKGEIEIGNVSINSLINEVVSLKTESMKTKSIDFKVCFDEGVVKGNYDLYLSLLINILDNAKKACKQNGEICINGTLLKDSYVISIKDNGEGMTNETINRLMEPFYMADKARSRAEGGAGIGMTIVKRIIKITNVKIDIDSHLGKGTVFKLFFQLGDENEK